MLVHIITHVEAHTIILTIHAVDIFSLKKNSAKFVLQCHKLHNVAL